MSDRSELRALQSYAERHGWTITKRRCGHLRWQSKTGAIVFTSSTPSDVRAVHKIRRDLVRNGLPKESK